MNKIEKKHIHEKVKMIFPNPIQHVNSKLREKKTLGIPFSMILSHSLASSSITREITQTAD